MKGKNSLEMTIEELVKENKEMMSNLTPEQQEWMKEFRKEIAKCSDERWTEIEVRSVLVKRKYWERPDWNPDNPTPAEVAEMVTM